MMKKSLLAAVCVGVLMVSAPVVWAQPLSEKPAHHEMKPHDKLAEKLKLTQEQKTKAEEIRRKGRAQMEPLIQERKILREKMDAVRKANMEEFEQILTPEQRKEFAEIVKKKAPKHHRKHLKDKK